MYYYNLEEFFNNNQLLSKTKSKAQPTLRLQEGINNFPLLKLLCIVLV